MLLYLASGRLVYDYHFASGRETHYTISDVRTDSLCFYIWRPGDKFMLLILPPGVKLIIQYQVSERIAICSYIWPSGSKFMLPFLPPGVKIII